MQSDGVVIVTDAAAAAVLLTWTDFCHELVVVHRGELLVETVVVFRDGHSDSLIR